MDRTFFASPLDPSVLPSLVLLGVLVWIIFHSRVPPSFWQGLGDDLRRLERELGYRFPHRHGLRLPVFSAETIRGKEAEFIRERLPRKVPYFRMALALLAIGVTLWWLAQ